MTIDWKFIATLEGEAVTTGYVPVDGAGKAIDNSGVTIASGVDIGQRSVDAIQAMELDAGLIERLCVYSGKKGDEALAELKATPLTVTSAEAGSIDACVRDAFERRVSDRWNSNAGASPNGAPPWNQLADRQQTVVMSVAWQYGTPWARTPKFWIAATSGRWADVIAELRDFGDRYPTRRGKEADYLEGENV